jgi:glutamate-1-semialdehyde 2,1-aminomutase
MDQLAPLGPVYQAGTLSGNPLATAAGLAVLAHLDDAAYATITATATRIADGLAATFAAVGIAVQTPRVATLAGLFFADAPVRDYAAARAADHERYAAFFHAMLARGVFLPPSGYEALFVGLAHDDEAVDVTLAAAPAAADELART